MSHFAAFLSSFFYVAGQRFQGRRDRGATAVEYGLLVGLIAVVIIVAVVALGGTLDTLFTDVNDTIVEKTGTGEKVVGS